MARAPRLALALGLLLLAATASSRAQAGEDDAVASAAAASPGLRQVMAGFAASGGVRAHFRETKQLALLDAPLETEGVVVFSPPDRLARHTTRPGSSAIVVRGGRVALHDETGHQVMELDADDPARHFVDNLSVLLRGDLEALIARYRVGFQSSEAGWQLELEPRSKVLRQLIESIRAEGRGAALLRMQVLEANGDSTVTVYSDVETGLEFDAAETERIFSLEDPAAP